MSNDSQRGMVKWIPFKSLNEQESFLRKMRERKNRVNRPLISSDKAKSINDALCSYKGEAISMRYFDKGHIVSENGFIQGIDALGKIVLFEGKRILFKDILDIVCDEDHFDYA